jgi:hypothetical protein
MHPPPTHVPPGWYPDPNGLPTQRWWDGQRWTDQLAPLVAAGALRTPAADYAYGPTGAAAANHRKVQARHHEAYRQLTLFAVLIPLVGFVLGILYLTKSRAVDRKLGEHLVVCAIVANLIWFAIISH